MMKIGSTYATYTQLPPPILDLKHPPAPQKVKIALEPIKHSCHEFLTSGYPNQSLTLIIYVNQGISNKIAYKQTFYDKQSNSSTTNS